MKSTVTKLGEVNFPEWSGERVYMVPFNKSSGLPKRLARWQRIVDEMLEGISIDSPIYLMVDQGKVKAGESHRRPGLHVDGNWIAAQMDHSHPPTHLHSGVWKDGGGRWNDATDGGYTPETIFLASDLSACVGYEGQFAATIGKKGEVTEVDISALSRIEFDSNRCYAGNATMLHESIAVPFDCLRTVVRLTVPGLSLGS
jgi:hypothetical protein